MTINTDPAREFTDFCMKLRESTGVSGADHLASKFGVVAWSTVFYEIITIIHKRIDSLDALLNSMSIDDDLKSMSSTQLNVIRGAFSNGGLNNSWSNAVTQQLTDAQLFPIKMASAILKESHGYTVPDSGEVAEIIADLDTLLIWLRDAQFVDNDFIRLALIEGLENFHIRLVHVEWYGWLETFGAMKGVIAAYLFLERGMPSQNVEPSYEAMLKKTQVFMQKCFDKAKFTKDVQETADWALRGYGALTAIAQASGSASITALLPHLN